MRRLVSVFALLLLLVPAVARAQSGTPPPGQPPPAAVPTNEFRDNFFGVAIGPSTFNDKWNFEDFKKPKTFVFSLDFWQRGILGADLDIGYSKLNALGTGSALGGPKLLTLTFGANIGPWIVVGPQTAIRPYFAIGGGLQRATFGDFVDFGNTSANRGVIDIGGGAVVYIVKSFGVRIDYRILKDVGSKDIITGDSGWGITGANIKRLVIGVVFAF
jgi:hypothetical protein